VIRQAGKRAGGDGPVMQPRHGHRVRGNPGENSDYHLIDIARCRCRCHLFPRFLGEMLCNPSFRLTVKNEMTGIVV
jgi:hypothetical protein